MTTRLKFSVLMASLAVLALGFHFAYLNRGVDQANGALARALNRVLPPWPATRPIQAELKKRLGPLAYEVTQRGMTEPAYKNAYWANTEPGLYLDVVSGEPVFSSRDKYARQTGWPCFTRPLDARAVRESSESALPGALELTGAASGAHLGEVFADGPSGRRYRLNSAALRFVPAKDLSAQGLGAYAKLFTTRP